MSIDTIRGGAVGVLLVAGGLTGGLVGVVVAAAIAGGLYFSGFLAANRVFLQVSHVLVFPLESRSRNLASPHTRQFPLP
jgi:hypothetical protein